MEQHSTPLAHAWEPTHLAALILRSWVRDGYGQLPAWTPGPVHEAYVHLLLACDALIAATQHAEREEHRRGGD